MNNEEKLEKKVIWYFLFVLFLSANPAAVHASAADSETCIVGMNVQYGQTEARSMLAMVNEFRTGPDAWVWESDNVNKVIYENLKELEYDYQLEKIAMQRAVEIALYWSHTRPNGSSCFSLYDGLYFDAGENIAAGYYQSAAKVFEGWLETEKNYSGQGHRRNMLSDRFTAVGIGHVYFNGAHYWVQEFGNPKSSESDPGANDSAAQEQVEIATSLIEQKQIVNVENQSVSYGNTIALPPLLVKILVAGTWPEIPVPVDTGSFWQIEDEEIAEIADGKIMGKKAGITNLITTVLGETMRVPLTVEPCSIQGAEVLLSTSSYSYDGEEKCPIVQVVLPNGEPLASDNYTVSYEDNIKPGTAKVIVTGAGNYQGTEQKNFTIVCEHRFDNGKVTQEPSCTEDGEKTYTCTICQSTKTEEITATGHQYGAPVFTWSGTQSCKAAFTCSQCSDEQGVDCAISQDIQPATCTSNGYVVYKAVADFQGEKYAYTNTQNIPKTGHTEVLDEAEAATCIKDGKTAGSHCSVCQEVLNAQEIIPATGHVYESSVTKATLKKDGSTAQICKVCQNVKQQTIIYRPGTVKLSADKYIYNGKTRKPAVTVTDRTGKRIGASNYTISYAKGRKNVGTYKVTVRFQGNYTDTVTRNFTIRPKKVGITKVQNVKGKKIKLRWKRNSLVTGYQIQYAAKLSFKGARNIKVGKNKKLNQTITGFAKGKRYYVRIRAYKMVSGKPIYSDWSKVRNVVIRK